MIKKLIKNNKIINILLLAFLIRFIVIFLGFIINKDYSIFFSPDSHKYMEIAKNLLYSGHFYYNGVPELSRTPGYPFFLFLCMLLSKNLLLIIIIQIIISSISVYYIYKIAQILFHDDKISLIASGLYAIEPLSIIFTGKILTETLFSFVFIIFVLNFLLYLDKKHIKYLIFSSILLAISTYIRPISYYLVIVIFLFLIIRLLILKSDIKRLFLESIIFLFIFILLLGIWQIRNYKVAKYKEFTAIPAINLYFFYGAAILAKKDHITFKEERTKLGYSNLEYYYKNHPEQKNWNQEKIYEYIRNEGKKIILKNPSIFLKIYLKGLIIILLDPGNHYYLKFYKIYNRPSKGFLDKITTQGIFKTIAYIIKNKPVILFTILLFEMILITYWAFFLIGFIKASKKIKSLDIFLLIIASYFIIVAAGPNATARFRHTIMIIISIYGANGVKTLYNFLKRKK